MKIFVAACIFSLLLLAGCSSAKKASEVSAAYVPVHRYAGMSCQQLVNEAEALRRATPALEAAVDSHRNQQTGVELVTWILFWPAAFALESGERQSSQLAQARGELQAIQQALMSNSCHSPGSSARGMSTDATVSSKSDGIESKLVILKNLRDKGLLTQEQYREQVNAVLNSR